MPAHQFLARVCLPLWRLRARIHQASVTRLAGHKSEQYARESQPVRWTCTYNGLAGGKGRAAFDCVADAKRFADLHATLIGVHANEWEQLGDSLVLRTPYGQYVVCPFNTPVETDR
jgi:hypothetical protein